MRAANPEKDQGAIVRIFSLRVFGTFALIFATAVAWQVQPDFSFDQIPSTAGLFFLLAAGLRLGVLPVHLPFTQGGADSQESKFLFDLAPVASSLTLIARLPGDFLTLNRTLLIIVQVLSAIAMLYGAMMWISRKTATQARPPYWIITLSAFALQCALNGDPGSSRVWGGLALLLSGGLLFSFNPPIRRIRFCLLWVWWACLACLIPVRVRLARRFGAKLWHRQRWRAH